MRVLAIWKPLFFPLLALLTVWVVLIVYLTMGPERVSEVGSGLGAHYKARRPDKAERLLGIVTAATEALAAEIGKMLNPYLLHHPLTEEEEQPTFAFPFSPAELNRGAVYGFRLNHVLELSDPMDAFRLEVIDLG